MKITANTTEHTSGHSLKTSALRLGRRILASSIAGLILAAASAPTQADDGGFGGQPGQGSGDHGHRQLVDHVLLISVDGLHQSDLAWYIQTHPASTLASLAKKGVDFINASTPFPSDSFPGMVAQATGGKPPNRAAYEARLVQQDAV